MATKGRLHGAIDNDFRPDTTANIPHNRRLVQLRWIRLKGVRLLVGESEASRQAMHPAKIRKISTFSTFLSNHLDLLILNFMKSSKGIVSIKAVIKIIPLTPLTPLIPLTILIILIFRILRIPRIFPIPSISRFET